MLTMKPDFSIEKTLQLTTIFSKRECRLLRIKLEIKREL